MTTPQIADYTFVNCTVVGPAVLAFWTVEVNHCDLEADIYALFWVVEAGERPLIVRAVAVTNTTSSACRFQSIGFAGTREPREVFDASNK